MAAQVVKKRILLVAYHYPPIQGSSGLQRTLKFSSYLGEFGWSPSVLTIHPRAYPAVTKGQLKEVPEDVVVERAFGIDVARHCSILGIYPKPLALPDRWSTWWLGAMAARRRLERAGRPDVVWSTFPIATAHLIGYSLSKHFQCPWIADFRDSMTEDDYPPSKLVRSVYRRIERRTVHKADRVVFTTEGTREMYRVRYPGLDPSKWRVIPNGYDEENFATADGDGTAPDQTPARKRLILIHSGLLYLVERNPTAFFDALADLKDQSREHLEMPAVILRASGNEAELSSMIARRGIDDLVSLKPPVEYDEALREMIAADGLLIFQGADCNHQIPAKLYEYLRAGTPILALTDPAGDTAATLRDCHADYIAPMTDKDAIRETLIRFLGDIRAGRARCAPRSTIERFSRREGTRSLAAILDECISRD